MDKIIRILIVDGYPIVKRMLKMQIELEPDLLVVGEGEMGSPVVDRVTQLEPDVILVDLDTPGETAIASARTLRAAFPQIPMLILSLDDDEVYHNLAAEIGATGFIQKQGSSAILIEAIRQAASS
jgi:two-component system response regulator DegU